MDMGTECCIAIWRPVDIRRYHAANGLAHVRAPRHSAVSYRLGKPKRVSAVRHFLSLNRADFAISRRHK
jgi:hypothetical protein